MRYNKVKVKCLPPQYFIPVPVKATPINVTVMADTTGGKIF